MRWQVEVSTVGKDGFEPYTVEADSWQRALQTPHAKRDLSLQSDLEQRLRDLEDF